MAKNHQAAPQDVHDTQFLTVRVCMHYSCHGDCGESANIYFSQDVYQLFTIIFFVCLQFVRRAPASNIALNSVRNFLHFHLIPFFDLIFGIHHHSHIFID